MFIPDSRVVRSNNKFSEKTTPLLLKDLLDERHHGPGIG
jgi:hypothetical protein